MVRTRIKPYLLMVFGSGLQKLSEARCSFCTFWLSFCKSIGKGMECDILVLRLWRLYVRLAFCS